jgi:hypothetical protein
MIARVELEQVSVLAVGCDGMRAFLVVFTVVLFLIALIGIGMGLAIMSVAAKAPNAGALVAFGAATIPFLIGTVALVGVGIIFAVDSSRAEQERTLLRIAHATETLVRYEAGPPPTDDPVLKAKREREAAAAAKSPYVIR